MTHHLLLRRQSEDFLWKTPTDTFHDYSLKAGSAEQQYTALATVHKRLHIRNYYTAVESKHDGEQLVKEFLQKATLKGSWPWPWIRSYCIPPCITHRPLPTSQISVKSKKLFVDGRRTYVCTDWHLSPALLGWLCRRDNLKIQKYYCQQLPRWSICSRLSICTEDEYWFVFNSHEYVGAGKLLVVCRHLISSDWPSIAVVCLSSGAKLSSTAIRSSANVDIVRP